MITIKEVETHKELWFEDRVYLGKLYQEVDGFYVFNPKREGGVWSEHTLFEIAGILKTLNKPWNDHINDYFDDLDNDVYYHEDFDPLGDK